MLLCYGAVLLTCSYDALDDDALELELELATETVHCTDSCTRSLELELATES